MGIQDIGDLEIHEFMVKELKLKGARLLIYAVIRQCTIKYGKFSGSLKDLSEFLGVSKMYCCQILKKFVDSGIVTKSFRNNSAMKIEYKANYL